MSPGFCKSVANIKIPKHKSCMDSQFTEFQKCFTTKITSLNSYISVKFTLTLERLSTEIKTHRLLFVFFNFLGFVTILSSRESLRSICCTELKLPPMLSDDALKAANGVYWKKLWGHQPLPLLEGVKRKPGFCCSKKLHNTLFDNV